MLSMAGIPPFIGFIGKFLLFSSAISANLILLAIIGIINSFISVYYYAKIISAMYSRKDEKGIKMENYIIAIIGRTCGGNTIRDLSTAIDNRRSYGRQGNPR